MCGNIVKTLILCFLSSFSLFFYPQGAVAFPYISVDIEGRVLAHHQAFDRWYPASLTKMMTAYLAFRALAEGKISAHSPIVLSEAAARVEPSRSGWRVGSTLNFDTALTVMLVKSANDMANALAEALAGSQTSFTAAMNSEAQRLGMTGTHFSNPSGLPDAQNYSNARDMAVLAVQIRRDFPQYAHYFDIPAIDFGHGRKVQPNSNNLIGRYSGADGMKTGFICASGFNLVASATRGGRTIVAVVLGADRIGTREEAAARLLSQGFKKSGSPKVNLANLAPYGDNQNQAVNLRKEICSIAASRQRLQYRDESGHQIFNSPFMTAMTEDPLPLPVRPIYEPPPPPSPPSAKKKGGKTAGRKGNTAAKTALAARGSITDKNKAAVSAKENTSIVQEIQKNALSAGKTDNAAGKSERFAGKASAAKANNTAAVAVMPKLKQELNIPTPEPWPHAQGFQQGQRLGQGLQKTLPGQNYLPQ